MLGTVQTEYGKLRPRDSVIVCLDFLYFLKDDAQKDFVLQPTNHMPDLAMSTDSFMAYCEDYFQTEKTNLLKSDDEKSEFI